ncbi:hypothetical protein P3370_23730, partial [Vibrio parahaemolyticus]|nr:hypothetical protein [Vibrio parahaemolyticus]
MSNPMKIAGTTTNVAALMVLILTAAQWGARIMTEIVNPPVQLTDEEEQELQAFETQHRIKR